LGGGSGARTSQSAGRFLVKIWIDPEKCQGHARCYAMAPDLFEVDDYGMSTALDGGEVPASLEDKARLAIANCPEYAIEVIE
jgi:ferredoxin